MSPPSWETFSRRVYGAALRPFVSNGIRISSGELRPSPRVLTIRVSLADGRDLKKALALEEEVALAIGARAVRIVREGAGVAVEIPLPPPFVREVPISRIAVGGYRAALGVSTSRRPVVLDFDRDPHALVVGSTRCGKTSALFALVYGLTYGIRPDELGLVVVDGKRRDLDALEGIEHLSVPIVREAGDAVRVVRSLVRELDLRKGDRSRASRRIVVVVDELEELLTQTGGTEGPLGSGVSRLAALGAGVGIHIVLATQSPRAEIVSAFRANLSARIVGACATATDGRVADGERGVGAHLLAGRGDFVYVSGSDAVRFQVSRPTEEDLAGLGRGEPYGDLELEAEETIPAPAPSQAPKPIAPNEIAWVLSQWEELGRRPGINATQTAVGELSDPPLTKCGERRARRVLEFAEELRAAVSPGSRGKAAAFLELLRPDTTRARRPG